MWFGSFYTAMTKLDDKNTLLTIILVIVATSHDEFIIARKD